MKGKKEVWAGFDLVVHFACYISLSYCLYYAYIFFVYTENNCYTGCGKIILINTNAKACSVLADY